MRVNDAVRVAVTVCAGLAMCVPAQAQESLACLTVAPPGQGLQLNEDLWLQTQYGPSVTYKAVEDNRIFDQGFNGNIFYLSQRGNPGAIDFEVIHEGVGIGHGAFLRAPLRLADSWANPNPSVALAIEGPTANVTMTGYTEAQLALRGSGQTRIDVTHLGSQVISRNLVRLANNGSSTFRFDNFASGTSWGFGSLQANDSFFVSRSGAAGLDLTLDGAGNLTILGALTQLSDRNAKRDIEALDGHAVLAKVAALPLASWTYISDARRARHVGPMAQDFAAAFGLGADDTHLAPSDVAGVGLVAVQALKRENDELRAALDGLTLRLDALEAQGAARSPR